MEETVTLSTLGGCVIRDIFRVADIEKKFKLQGNVGFISALSINAKPLDNGDLIREVEEALDKCEDSSFHKRNKALDLEKSVWPFFRENKGEYLLLDMIDIMYPVLTKDDYFFTCRNTDHMAERVFKNELMKRGFVYKPVRNFSSSYILKAVEKMCRNVLEIWPSEKIILLNTMPTNMLFNGRCIDSNYMYLRGQYEHGTYWWLLARVYKKAREILKCPEIKMPPMQFVTADINHTWGIHPYHYTESVYRYLYLKIWGHISHTPDEMAAAAAQKEIEDEFYRRMRVVPQPNQAMSEACVECIAQENIIDYLVSLRRLRSCMIIFSLKDTAGEYLDSAIQEKLYNLGMSENLVKQYCVGYAGIICECMPVFEKKSEKDGYIDEVLHIGFQDINIISRSFRNGNCSKIIINGVDYSVNRRGLNIVVYDFGTRKVVDSVSFDTHSPDCPCSRRQDLTDKEDRIRVEIKKLGKKIH